MAMSDLSKTSMPGLLPTILRNSVIILKYLWIWFLWHTWKAVNKILQSKGKPFWVIALHIEPQRACRASESKETFQMVPRSKCSSWGSQGSLTSAGPTAKSEQTSLPLDFLFSAPSSTPWKGSPWMPVLLQQEREFCWGVRQHWVQITPSLCNWEKLPRLPDPQFSFFSRNEFN